jgi:hypothetical protein
MAEKYYFSDSHLEEVDNVLRKVAPHPKLLPASADAAKRDIEHSLDKSTQLKPVKLNIGTASQISSAIQYLLRGSESLSESERRNLLSVLIEQRDLQVDEEANLRVTNKVKQITGSLRWNLITLAPLCLSLLTALYSVIQIDQANNSFNSADLALKQNPNYQLSQKYSDMVNNLDTASLVLTQHRTPNSRAVIYPDPRESKASLRAAFEQGRLINVGNDITTTLSRILDVTSELPDSWSPTYDQGQYIRVTNNSDQFVSQRVKIEDLREQMRGNQQFNLSKVPLSLFQEINQARDKFGLWTATLIGSLTAGTITTGLLRRGMKAYINPIQVVIELEEPPTETKKRRKKKPSKELS